MELNIIVLGEEIPVYSNQTWESLLLLASQLTRYKPKIIFVNGKIGTYGSAAGSVAILVNRNSWLSVILPNMCYVNGQLNGQTITNIIQDEVSVNIPSFYKNYSTLDEFVAASLETTNSVSSYTDFNSITTSGQYVFLSTQITGKEHAPSESSGCLLVLGGSMIRQIYFENSAENKVFIRKNFASQGWSAWVRL